MKGGGRRHHFGIYIKKKSKLYYNCRQNIFSYIRAVSNPNPTTLLLLLFIIIIIIHHHLHFFFFIIFYIIIIYIIYYYRRR